MDLIKRHVFLIICGVVGLAGIVLAFMGVTAMADVKEEMDKAAQVANQIPGYQSNPVNWKSIEAEDERIKLINEQYQQVLDWAKSLNPPEQLVEDCFPTPERDQRTAFRDAYAAKRLALYRMLTPGTVASTQDVADMKEQIEEEAKANRASGLEPAPGLPGEQEKDKTPKTFPSGVPTDEGAAQMAEVRANIKKARQIYCYATPEAIEEIKEIEDGTITLPEPIDMWYAQLSIWVTEPVIEALASVNNAAAAEITADGGDPWVGLLPIKEVISVRSSANYILPAATGRTGSPPGGPDIAFPIASPDQVFTHTASNDLYEVIHFAVKMVVDAREIPTIIDAICEDKLTTVLRVAYEDVSFGTPELWKMSDRIYGSGPTVSVVMDFETILLGDLYRPLMLDSVLESLGQQRPEPTEEE
jgi:hypothetical protein